MSNGAVSGAAPARVLFDEIKRDGAAWMNRAKKDGCEEATYLDFCDSAPTG